jgi:hypothetical protein
MKVASVRGRLRPAGSGGGGLLAFGKADDIAGFLGKYPGWAHLYRAAHTSSAAALDTHPRSLRHAEIGNWNALALVMRPPANLRRHRTWGAGGDTGKRSSARPRKFNG